MACLPGLDDTIGHKSTQVSDTVYSKSRRSGDPQRDRHVHRFSAMTRPPEVSHLISH
jgi:hypothetical protein